MTDFGPARSRPVKRLDCQIDRWNLHDRAWWASWALTPHHYYHPKMAGVLILE